MTDILTVLTQNILPIFVVAACGYALQRWGGVQKQTLSRVVFYCFSPCLVFSSLVNSQLPGGELIDLAVFTAVTISLMGLVGWGVARLLHLSRMETVSLLLMLMFVNSGNYGLTLVNLRYGDDGLARAVVYFVTSTLLLYSVGIVIASTGQLSWSQALARLWRMPPFYAALLAILIYSWQIPIPAPILRGIEITGEGAIPTMLLVLGMQMADEQQRMSWRLTIPTVLLRLVGGPALGVLVAMVLGLQGMGRATSIIEAGMPPAVFTIVLATEFALPATAVTGTVVIATLLSPLTLATTIAWLGL